MNKFMTLVATLFGVGHLPKMPGTWGSLFALLIGVPAIHFIPWYVFIGLILILIPIGIMAANTYQAKTGEHDSGKVVIDELVGQWIALAPLALAVPFTFAVPFDDFRWATLLAFGLFRFFDVIKPWPISWMDKNIKGGWGVMADDIAAGVAAAMVLFGLGFFI
ncbi:MAG: phosphatidylglycerophosphatase A [Sphingomonadales bacterium]